MYPRQFRLLEIHQRIDDALRRELQRRWPDGFTIVRLKKMKVRVKNRLYAMVRGPAPRRFTETAR